MEVLVVAGARPNFMKVAPILEALRARGHGRRLVHTGQHYDGAMSDAFFRDLGLPEPDHHLGVGSASHAIQTARIMEAFEPLVRDHAPDWVVVVGDVNSTLACALVVSKLGTPTQLAHVEAGLRSGDWRMPEEVNRVLTDRLSDLLLTPSRDAHANLAAEGIDARRVVFVGNVMIDSLHRTLPRARALALARREGLEPGRFVLTTLHRPSNVDDPERLEVILEALHELAAETPVAFPMHPRTKDRVASFGLEPLLARIRCLPPLGYVEMVSLQADATMVVTDSGGIQEETTVLGIPCLTLRESTERPVTVTQGTNRLLPEWPPRASTILFAVHQAMATRSHGTPRVPEGWDGRAAERIVDALEAHRALPELATSRTMREAASRPAGTIG